MQASFAYAGLRFKHRTADIFPDRRDLRPRSGPAQLVPTGDSAGFTARFYFSIVHGCIPVYVDLWQRNMTFEDLALPFPSLIDWRRVLIYRNYAHRQNLLAELKALPHREVKSRLEYIESIAHWLVTDVPNIADVDAPAALIRELEGRLL